VGVAECGNYYGFFGLCRFNFGHVLDIYKPAIDAVTAAEKGVNSVTCVDFVGRDNVLCECLNDASVREGSGCSECLHRAGPPTFLV